MSQMNKIVVPLYALLIIVFVFAVGRQTLILLRTAQEVIVAKDKELAYAAQADALNDYLFKEGVPVRSAIINQTLHEIDKNVVKYFPNGPFTRNDFIAMVLLESNFKQYEVGTHGEKGIFQIMPGEFLDYHVKAKNHYDINVNTDLAFKVLSIKYGKHQDYKKSIIAYNGVVRLKGGRWSEKYWKCFYARKLMVDLILKQLNG